MAVMLSDLLRNPTFNRSAHCTQVSDQFPLGLLFIFSVDVGVFVIGLSQISSSPFFSLKMFRIIRLTVELGKMNIMNISGDLWSTSIGNKLIFNRSYERSGVSILYVLLSDLLIYLVYFFLKQYQTNLRLLPRWIPMFMDPLAFIAQAMY